MRTYTINITREGFAVYFPPVGPSVCLDSSYAIRDLIRSMSIYFPTAKVTIKPTIYGDSVWTTYRWEVEA